MSQEQPKSYITQWLLQDRVLYTYAKGTCTVADIEANDQEVSAMLDSVTTERVHYVVNVTDLEDAPSIPALVRQKFLRHQRMGWYITVGANPVVRFIGAAAGRLTGTKFQFVRHLREAKTQLQRIDETLPDLTDAFAKLQDGD